MGGLRKQIDFIIAGISNRDSIEAARAKFVLDTQTEYNTVINALVRLTTVYTDELQSGTWQKSLKAAAAFQAKFAVEERSDDKKDSTGEKKKKSKKWKYKAPKEGAAETKKVDGKQWNWCAKCGRWTLTHSTSTHTGRKSTAATDNASTESAATANTASALPAVGFYVL